MQMHLPEFFAASPRLRVFDPLADFLGAAQDGVFEYVYADVVKLAGHSCPTVASAFLPQVVVDFELNTQQFALAGWVVTMYLAAYAVSMTFAGRLSDLYGRRVAYLVCLGIFIVGSLLVAVTRGLETVSYTPLTLPTSDLV